MGKAIPLQLGEYHFEKTGDARIAVRKTLNSYTPGQRVAQEDESLLRAVLARHPEASAKTGSGVDHFMVRSADYGTQCFWVVRTDDTTERFSFKDCL